MVHAYKKGKIKNAPAKIRELAGRISDEDARDFAKTRSGDLPEKKASPLDYMFVRGFLSRLAER